MSLDTIGILLLDILVWFCNLQFSTKKILSNCLVTTIIITRRCLNPTRDYSGHMHAKCHFFSPPKLLSTFAETIIHQRRVVTKVFFFCEGLWIYDFKMWEAFSGGWNTIHLLWSLNQTDRCFPMIHDASMLKRNASYHSAFLSVHMLYTTSATVNPNMMRFLLFNSLYLSCEFLCQPPPLIIITLSFLI